MVHWVKAFATKPDGLSLMPETSKQFLAPIVDFCGTRTYPPALKEKVKKNKLAGGGARL